MEHPSGHAVDLIWNRGIAALCDHRFPDEFLSGKAYSPVPEQAGALWSNRLPGDLIDDPSTGGRIEEGDLVWVRLSWLKSFVRQVLPAVKAKFVLVTGDSDSCVPSDLGSIGREIVGCSRVILWYTQNYDGSVPSEKVLPIPIGIDFHSLSRMPQWGEKVSGPREQEHELISIGLSLPPLAERDRQVYVDFAWQKGFGLHRRFRHPLTGTTFQESRRKITSKLRGNARVYFQNSCLSKSEMWRRRGKYAFVLSPHGWGLDCHRTWEALALGHIVLVPSSSLDDLYTDLPVVALKSWSEITPANLERWHSMRCDAGANHEKLKSSYWVNKMRSSLERGKGVQANQSLA